MVNVFHIMFPSSKWAFAFIPREIYIFFTNIREYSINLPKFAKNFREDKLSLEISNFIFPLLLIVGFHSSRVLEHHVKNKKE